MSKADNFREWANRQTPPKPSLQLQVADIATYWGNVLSNQCAMIDRNKLSEDLLIVGEFLRDSAES